MTSSILKHSAAVLALFAAQPALAEISAQEVWDSWKSSAAGFGESLSAQSETYAGGVLTLDGVTSDIAFPEGTVGAAVDRVVMAEQGDGTVSISVEGDYLLTVDAQPEDGPPITMTFAMAMPGLAILASGDIGDTTYDYSADSVSMTLASLEAAGEPLDGTIDIAMTGVDGSYRLIEGDILEVDSGINAAGLTMLVEMADPEMPDNRVRITADYTDFSTDSLLALDGGADMADPQALLSGALAVAVRYSHGGGGYALSGNGPEGAFAFTARSDSGSMDFAIDDTGVNASFVNFGVELAASGDTIPFPEITLAAAEVSADIATPLQTDDQPSDLAFGLTLDGLTVSEMIWSMVDPGGALPHDPATLIVDVTGQMRLTADLTDKAAMNAPIPPFDFEALDLNNLTVAIAGAELTGSGGFDFSLAPEGSMPGMPGVAGDITLRLAGANQLLDTLVGMGLLPDQQAGMARMMMGAMARPVGEDELESKILLGADGSITANGQQLR